MELKVVGKKIPNVDSVLKVQGKSKYTVDLELPGMLYGKILRSIHPHAKILNIDTGRAKRLPGVKAIIDSTDTPRVKYGVLIEDEEVMASDKARYMGNEVAAVAAIDEETAQEALELIQVDYEPLPALYDPEEAMMPGAPKIHDVEGNLAVQLSFQRGENVERGFLESDEIFEHKFSTQMVHQCHLEPNSCIASFEDGKLTLWTGYMDPFALRLKLAKALNIGESTVKLIQNYIGGAFGAKVEMLPLQPICALLSMKTGRPVKMVYSREEEFFSTRPREAIKFYLKTGVKKDGSLVAQEIKVIGDMGAYAGYGPMIAGRAALYPGNLYRFSHIKADIKCVYTNKTSIGPFRGFGDPQLTFAYESHLDVIAEDLRLDPLELRLKNIYEVGQTTAHGWQLNSCGIKECLLKVAEKGYWERKEELGKGLACAIFLSEARVMEGFGGSVAFVKIFEDGKVKVITGEADYGQGARTVFTQMAAEELGVSIKDVEILQTDSDFSPFALGPYGDRVTISGGNAVRLAAVDARKQIFQLASHMLEAHPEDLELKDGRIYVKGSPEKFTTLAEVAKKFLYGRGGSAIIGKGVDEKNTVPMDIKTQYGNISSAYTFVAQMAQVEVDKETGKVKVVNYFTANDLGKAINPLTAEGQAEGSVAQGLGYGLMEGIFYEGGAVINPSFLDYRILTAIDMPSLETMLVETNDPNGPYGAKGAGEPSIVPGAAALANAIYDATGTRIHELPITPEKVLASLGEKG